MAYENNDKKMDSVYSQRIRAGKRRTYFFDVRATRGNDYYLTITESRKRFNEDGYDRHKIFLYKEDFNKFLKGLTEAIDYVKTDLMPDFDFDAFNHDQTSDNEGEGEFQRKEEQPIGNSEAPETHVNPEKHVTQENPITDQTADPIITSTPNHNDEEVDKW